MCQVYLFIDRAEMDLKHGLCLERQRNAERVCRIVGTSRCHQGREGHQGKIGDESMGDRRRMANSIPENIAVRVCTDVTWCKWIAADTGICNIGDPKLLRVGGDLLKMSGDVEPSNLDREGGFKLL
jgi:hypothetical protein